MWEVILAGFVVVMLLPAIVVWWRMWLDDPL